MLLPMSPTSSMFLLAETRDNPMHVGGLQLFAPPAGADAWDVRALFEEAIADDEVASTFLKRPRRSVTSLGQWGWEVDKDFDIEHHVRRSALPKPGAIRDLLELVSRLHSSLLDRNRPMWECHIIEGLADGRIAVYTKTHHALMDGISALKTLTRSLSTDPDERDMPAPWSPPRTSKPPRAKSGVSPVGAAVTTLRNAAGVGPSLARTVLRAARSEGGAMSFAAPRSMFNVKITGARRFAAQSWPLERLKAVAKANDATLNDVILAMSSGALRHYMIAMDALPDSSLTAMVPVSLRSDNDAEGGGNAVGMVTCCLGTDLDDPDERIATVRDSMSEGKQSMANMSSLEILAVSGISISPLGIWPALNLVDNVRPPFNLVISNVPGPREPMYWNGARLDGFYPLSIPLDGQALNITCTSYATEVAFGLTGCRRSVPHLQHLLTYLEDELYALEQAAGL